MLDASSACRGVKLDRPSLTEPRDPRPLQIQIEQDTFHQYPVRFVGITVH